MSPLHKQETLRAAGCQSAQPTASLNRQTLSRAPLRRIVPLFLAHRPVEFEPIGQHDDGLGAALALIHRESNRLGAVYEQAAAKALGVLDDPRASSILPDEQTGIVRRARSLMWWWIIDFASYCREGPAMSPGGSIA